MCLHVSVEGTGSITGKVTLTTLKGLLTSVRSHVSFKSSRLSARKVALVTLEGLLA